MDNIERVSKPFKEDPKAFLDLLDKLFAGKTIKLDKDVYDYSTDAACHDVVNFVLKRDKRITKVMEILGDDHGLFSTSEDVQEPWTLYAICKKGDKLIKVFITHMYTKDYSLDYLIKTAPNCWYIASWDADWGYDLETCIEL